MKALIIAALATAALAISTDATLAQRGPDVVPMGRNAAGQPVCPGNYVVQGNACVSIYAGRQGGPDSVPIGRNSYGQPSCPGNFVIRGNACVSIYARQAPGGFDAGQGGGYGGGQQGGYRGERYRDDYDSGYARRRQYDEYDRPRRRSAVEPVVNWRGELQCPSNYILRGDYCVSIY